MELAEEGETHVVDTELQSWGGTGVLVEYMVLGGTIASCKYVSPALVPGSETAGFASSQWISGSVVLPVLHDTLRVLVPQSALLPPGMVSRQEVQ